MKKINIILAFVVYLFAFFYLWQIMMLPDRDMPGTLKSSFMPLLLFSVLAGVNTVFLIVSLTKPCTEKCDFVIHRYELLGILKVVLLITLYVMLMKYVGFVLITPVAVFFLMKMMGASNLKEQILTALLVSVFVYVLFVVIFKVQLPGGMLI